MGMTALEQQAALTRSIETASQAYQYADTASRLGTSIQALAGLFQRRNPSSTNPATFAADFKRFVEAEIARLKAEKEAAAKLKGNATNVVLYTVGGIVGVSLLGLMIWLVVRK